GDPLGRSSAYANLPIVDLSDDDVTVYAGRKSNANGTIFIEFGGAAYSCVPSAALQNGFTYVDEDSFANGGNSMVNTTNANVTMPSSNAQQHATTCVRSLVERFCRVLNVNANSVEVLYANSDRVVDLGRPLMSVANKSIVIDKRALFRA